MTKWIFKCPCPCCPPGGNNTTRTWTRTKCGHTLYIWDDGDIGCPDCSSYSFILDNTFTCSNHPNDARSPNIQYLLRYISVIAQVVDMPYKKFKTLQKKIEEEGRKRGLPVDDD
jgi:hypothetical protein